MSSLRLPDVTLCAATSVNVHATVAALQHCQAQVEFGRCVLFTDSPIKVQDIETIEIPRLTSSQAYSEFVLTGMVEHIRTAHVLVVQWDGFILDANRWTPEFLEYDFVGAAWPQFDDNHNVGNGGFSMRSRKLLEACRDPDFDDKHPEDVAICRVNRHLLERRYGLRFAGRAVADRFSFERQPTSCPTFGFHGVYNMIPALGVDRFWEIYRSLDNPDTAFLDWKIVQRQLGYNARAWARRSKFLADFLTTKVGRLTSGDYAASSGRPASRNCK